MTEINVISVETKYFLNQHTWYVISRAGNLLKYSFFNDTSNMAILVPPVSCKKNLVTF
jgi:hypothetical protein